MLKGGGKEIRREIHIKCAPGEVAENVLLCGDPRRAERIAEHLSDCQQVAANRGYLVFTGKYEGLSVSVCATGIGGPSTAIAMEELGHVGARRFIRVGSAGGLQPDVDPGHLVIATAAWRFDGTSSSYIDTGYPAVANLEVTNALIGAAELAKTKVHVGLVSSGDAFYAPKPEGYLTRLQQAHVLAGEMECSLVFVLSLLRGWQAGAILVIDGNIIKGLRKSACESPIFYEAEEQAIKIALEALLRVTYGKQAETNR